MKFPINWKRDDEIRKAFVYATRTGIGVRFGSRPIGWYQSHQHCALAELESKARMTVRTADPIQIRLKKGTFQVKHNGRWHSFATPDQIFRHADNTCRK